MRAVPPLFRLTRWRCCQRPVPWSGAPSCPIYPMRCAVTDSRTAVQSGYGANATDHRDRCRLVTWSDQAGTNDGSRSVLRLVTDRLGHRGDVVALLFDRFGEFLGAADVDDLTGIFQPIR